MFKFPILGQFLISKRNLKGFQFLSKLCCEQTHWFGRPTPLLGNKAMKGDISSKQILRIGMFRTPFSCGYYQQHCIFCETKIILSCLFLLEAHGLEYFYYRPIVIKYMYHLMVTDAYKYDMSARQMLWQMRKHCWVHK